MRYELIHSPQRQDGHRVFRESPTQRIVLGDFSGPTPSTTEDGPLYPDFTRPALEIQTARGFVYLLPVLCERGGLYHTPTSAETVRVIESVAGQQFPPQE